MRRVIEQSAGRAVVEVRPDDCGIQIDVKSSQEKDPVSDFHVWMPGCENALSPFHPLFVERLGPAKVIRFMDWLPPQLEPFRPRNMGDDRLPNCQQIASDKFTRAGANKLFRARSIEVFRCMVFAEMRVMETRYWVAATRGLELPPRAMCSLRMRRTSSMACGF